MLGHLLIAIWNDYGLRHTSKVPCSSFVTSAGYEVSEYRTEYNNPKKEYKDVRDFKLAHGIRDS